jgi:hypothetical protein
LRGLSVVRVVIGLLLWGTLFVVAGRALLDSEHPARGTAERLLRFAGESPLRVEMLLRDGGSVGVGDPVLTDEPGAYLVQVGRVSHVRREGRTVVATLEIHPERRELIRDGARAEAFTVPSSAAWVARTLLPPARQEKIASMARDFLAEQGTAIRDALWPEVEAGLLDVLAHLEREVPVVLEQQSPRWNALLVRHRDGVVRLRLQPVLQEVVLALARDRFRPLLDRVGEDLWRALPVWSLGWRYVWQSVPFTSEEQVKARFEKYLHEDAAPILAKHAPEAARIAKGVVRETLQDPRVREALSLVLRTIAADPELAALTKDLVDRLLLENEELATVLERRWNGGLKQAVAREAGRLEPLVRKAVDAIVLDDAKTGINPRLSRVLRSRVLMKDGRWVLLTAGTGELLPDGASIPGAVRHD